MDDLSGIIASYGGILRTNPLFHGFSDLELEGALASLEAKPAIFKKGDMIHSAGKVLKSFGLLLSGVIQVFADGIDGNRMIMATVTEGETFGESLCFLKVKNSPVYIQATEATTLLWLSPDRIFAAQDNSSGVNMQQRFTAMLAGRTLSMNSRIQILSKLTLRDKLIAYFSETLGKTGSTTFTVPFNREDMAAYMGTNRSALSRELSAMKKEGMIDFYKNTFRLLKQ